MAIAAATYNIYAKKPSCSNLDLNIYVYIGGVKHGIIDSSRYSVHLITLMKLVYSK